MAKKPLGTAAQKAVDHCPKDDAKSPLIASFVAAN